MRTLGYNTYWSSVVQSSLDSTTCIAKLILTKRWLKTWDKLYANGVVRYDLVFFKNGEAVDLDITPNGELRAFSRGAEGKAAIEGLWEDLGIEEPPEPHESRIYYKKQEE